MKMLKVLVCALVTVFTLFTGSVHADGNGARPDTRIIIQKPPQPDAGKVLAQRPGNVRWDKPDGLTDHAQVPGRVTFILPDGRVITIW